MTNKSLMITIGILIFALAAFILLNLEDPGQLEGDPAEKAEQWVKEEAGTFLERGGNELELKDTKAISDGVYEVTFNFESAFAGYGGVSEGEMNAQVLTSHTIIVRIEDGVVVSALTDDTYNEIEEVFVEEEEEQEEEVVAEENLLELYFVIVDEGQERVEAVERTFLMEDGVEEEVIVTLLEGPSSEEEENGYSTAINSEVALNSFRIDEGIASVVFSD
jgi:hypothetical protein